MPEFAPNTNPGFGFSGDITNSTYVNPNLSVAVTLRVVPLGRGGPIGASASGWASVETSCRVRHSNVSSRFFGIHQRRFQGQQEPHFEPGSALRVEQPYTEPTTGSLPHEPHHSDTGVARTSRCPPQSNSSTRHLSLTGAFNFTQRPSGSLELRYGNMVATSRCGLPPLRQDVSARRIRSICDAWNMDEAAAISSVPHSLDSPTTPMRSPLSRSTPNAVVKPVHVGLAVVPSYAPLWRIHGIGTT